MPEAVFLGAEGADEILRAHLIATIAGKVAEERFLGRQLHWDSPEFSSNLEDVQELAPRLFTGADLAAQMEFIHAAADAIIQGRWATIEAVAKELIRSTVIDGQRLADILRS